MNLNPKTVVGNCPVVEGKLEPNKGFIKRPLAKESYK